MKRWKRFDPAKGGKLSTYAACGSSSRSSAPGEPEQDDSVARPLGTKSRRCAVFAQMSEELGREPTDDELGEEIASRAGRFPS